MSARRVIAASLAATSLALVALCDVLVLLHHLRHWPHGYTYWLEGSISQPIWVAIALLIIVRVPGNRLGWVALAMSLFSAVQLSSGSLATQLAGTGPATPTVDWLAAVSAVGQIGIVGGLIVFGFLAPDGRLIGPRWRPIFGAAIAALSLVAMNNVFTDSGVRNEVFVARVPVSGVPSGALHAAMFVANGIVLVAVPVGLAGLIVRYRRGSTVQRLQLKWLVLAAFVALFLAVVVQAIASDYWPRANWIGTVLWAVIGSCLPAGVAVGVLRYRLYDIDRILSRTVSYFVVTGALVGVYVGAVALIETVLGFSSSVAVAASTLAAAVGFQPVRHRVQRVVDRRFDRAAYDASRTVEAFSNRLRDEVDTEAVRTALFATVSTAVAPASVSIWMATT
jgi:hypothetical protein